MNLILFLIIYLLIINVFAFVQFKIDKTKAQKGKWRISEAQLFITSILGGSLGSVLGMQLFRHKTKHWYFVWGMPAILILHILISVFLIYKF